LATQCVAVCSGWRHNVLLCAVVGDTMCCCVQWLATHWPHNVLLCAVVGNTMCCCVQWLATQCVAVCRSWQHDVLLCAVVGNTMCCCMQWLATNVLLCAEVGNTMFYCVQWLATHTPTTSALLYCCTEAFRGKVDVSVAGSSYTLLASARTGGCISCCQHTSNDRKPLYSA